VRLRELEELFVRAVREELPPPLIDATFVTQGELDAQRRIRIYQHAYWVRQERVLRETFPRLCAHLGDARFARLAIDHLRRTPSRRPAIEWLGELVPALLREQSDIPAHLRDLARLEWARFAALLAPTPKHVVTLAALADVDFAACSAELAESVSLLSLVGEALRAFHDDASVVEALGSAHERCPEATSEAREVACLVWRKDQRSYHRSLNRVEFEALTYVQERRTFADVCVLFPDAEAAAACIGRWIRDELLVSLRPSE
jgi:hypothetical protein